jgi:hypothetical protein
MSNNNNAILPLPNASHFSFTRDKYDSCEYDQYLQESTAPFQWISDHVYENNSHCHVDQSPFLQGNNSGIQRSDIDVESELKNITRANSRCPDKKYNPSKHTVQTRDYLSNCLDSRLVPEYTRTDKPCNLPGVSTFNLSIHPLCNEIQDLQKIHLNSYSGVNTRLVTRDAYAKQMGRLQ